MMKAVAITVLAAIVCSFLAIGLRKYAGIHIPSGAILGLIIGLGGGVSGHFAAKFKQETKDH